MSGTSDAIERVFFMKWRRFLTKDYESMDFERKAEIGQVGVTELTQFEPALDLAISFKRFLVRFGSHAV